MTLKENIVLCDCKPSEVESLRDALNTNGENFTIHSYISNWKRTGAMSELRRYGKYFWVGFRYFCSRKKYGTLIGWQQFYVLIFCFFCSLFHAKKKNVTVALNFTYKEKKGKLAKIYRWFMKHCTNPKYMDYLHVLSVNYAKIISEEFQFPLERILVFPFGINDPYEKFSKLPYPDGAPKQGYVLAIGRSNRDYDFLIPAWKNIEYPLVIIADTYKGDNQGNTNVSILRNVAGEESYPWISHCNCMVLPINDGTICSGDTVLLTALAMKKKVLITSPSTLAEMYIVHKENGLCVEKNAEEFEILVRDMLFSETYNYLAETSRNSYLENYSRMSMGRRLREILFGK